MSGHQQRAHSKFSASGSERWLNCSASVDIEEKSPPSKDTSWSLEGTEAHEVKQIISTMRTLKSFRKYLPLIEKDKDPMIGHAMKMVRKVEEIKATLFEPIHEVEVRVYNKEIHPEMFGTVDENLAELFGTLHVFDFKYGQGHIVDPKENTQMIQYALGIAEKYDWQFTDVVIHICQPRGSGSGHKEWHLTIEQLKGYRELWRKGVARVEGGKARLFEGSWCHWCRGRQIDPATGVPTCPKKREAIEEKRNDMFTDLTTPNERNENGIKEESDEESFEVKSEADWKKESRAKKGKGRQKKNPFEVKEETEEDDFERF